MILLVYTGNCFVSSSVKSWINQCSLVNWVHLVSHLRLINWLHGSPFSLLHANNTKLSLILLQFEDLRLEGDEPIGLQIVHILGVSQNGGGVWGCDVTQGTLVWFEVEVDGRVVRPEVWEPGAPFLTHEALGVGPGLVTGLLQVRPNKVGFVESLPALVTLKQQIRSCIYFANYLLLVINKAVIFAVFKN